MTDEQVQRIVDALAGNPWDPWTGAAIAVASALFGFLLSQLAERSRRKRQLADDRSTARRAAAQEATAYAMQKMSSPGVLLRKHVETLPADMARHIVALQSADDSYAVGQWWFRQITRIDYTPADGKEFSRRENELRAAAATSVSQRLNAWAQGKLAATEFAKANDAAWDKKIAADTTPALAES